ncbi:hypothetical protein D1BOALGB6SA_7590 [Olavius sp. associated proteobacterium Delta 1]|nr:hypothetical protein D1BOALGB6SA_7590 [Olavius sp. associated proteobacterium Delta 1]
MAALRIILIFLLCLTASTLLWGHPSFSETNISEQTLTSDIVIKEMYQPGSGLPVGKIQSVRGEAIVFHRDPTVGYRIQTGLPLYAGDIMRTGQTAWILCRLIDGSHIVLTPKTTLTILQSSYNSSRKTGVSFLYLQHGGARFMLNPMPDLISYDYKVQTEEAFTLASEADFVVKANPAATEIIAFEKSRLEVTAMAQPEEITFLSDFQRTIVAEKTIFPTVETLSREDIEIMMAGFHTAPPGKSFAAGTINKRRDRETEDMLIEEDIVED